MSLKIWQDDLIYIEIAEIFQTLLEVCVEIILY